MALSSQLACWSFLIFIPLLLLLLITRRRKSEYVKAAELPPGPPKLPIIGSLQQIGPLPHQSLQKLSAKHGPLMLLQLGSFRTLVISSGEAARDIFKAHDLAFSGRPSLYVMKRLSYGFLSMSLAPYGEYWRQLRKVSVLELLSARRVQSFRTVREEEVALLVASISRAASSSSIDLSEMTLLLSSSIIRRIVFGNNSGSSRSDDAGGNKFHGILKETQNLLGGFCISDFFPWMTWIHRFTGLKGRLEKNFHELDSFFDEVIDEHLSSEWPEPEHEDLVHVLLRLQKDPSYSMIFSSRNHIKGLLMDFFIAGSDTSSAAVVWTMTELMRNPRVMRKAQQEAREVFDNEGKVEEGKLQQLHYLKLVIKEGMRLHPPAPLLVPRETTEMCRLQGYVIPKKTRVFVNAKAISMDPKAWESPEEFWPERFLTKDVDFRGLDFDLIPFGVGRRSCPGINFAIVVVELVLASLLYHFDWELPVGMRVEDLDVEEAIGLTTHKRNPLCLVAKQPKPNVEKV